MKNQGPFQILNLAFMGFALALATGCSSDTISSGEVSSESLHQTYSVTYSEADADTRFDAQFRVGGWSGTTVQIESPAELRINGQKTQMKNLLGTRYQTRKSGFNPDAIFEFRDKEGKVYVNAIQIKPLSVDGSDPVVAVNRGHSMRVNAPGDLGGDEIKAVIRQIKSKHGSAKSNFAMGQYDRGRSQIVFSPEQLQNLESGAAELELERRVSRSLTQSTRSGGNISATYKTRPMAVTISNGSPTLP